MFQSFLIAKKVAENASASIAKKKVVENVNSMLSTPENPRLGRIDVPNEATLLARCILLKKGGQTRNVFQLISYVRDLIELLVFVLTNFCSKESFKHILSQIDFILSS